VSWNFWRCARYKDDIALLIDDPKGTVEAGLSPGEVGAGVKSRCHNRRRILVGMDDPVFGKNLGGFKCRVAKIPELYAQMESEGRAVERIVPATLTSWYLLGMLLAQ
jgi:hypothetical protein